jgi:hypothetical protein
MFEQERFIGRLQRHVLAEPDVLVCFLYGSFGRRVEDAYSDVDVALVYRGPAERDAAWAEREEFVRAVMPYVAARSYDAYHLRPYLHIALYSNGTKVDFRYETTEAISPSPGDSKIRILKDSDQWGERFQAMAARLAPTQPYIDPEALMALDTRFWIRYWNVLRLLKRGGIDKPFESYLKLLYFSILPLRDALPPEEPARQDLARASFGRDERAMMIALRELLATYLAARAAVIRRQNLVFPIHTAFESEIRRLAERLTG